VVEPGRKYNPLVLAGESGLGKTHILHGVGNALILKGVGPVACLSGHTLLAEVAALTTPDQLAAWRTRYHWVGALLLDDLHLLANQTRAQGELLLLFGALLDGGRQLVFSCGRRFSDLEGFDPRLLTRLQAGMVVDLLPPDREVRLAVVKGLLARTPAAADAALVDYLAGRPADSVRAVQGAVQRVLGEAEAQRVAPSPAFAREILDVVESKIARSPRRPPAGASGIVSPGLGAVRSREKMTAAWRDAADRVIPELR